MQAAVGDSLHAWAASFETREQLDRVVALLDEAAQRVVPEGPVRRFFLGRWLGHSLHPALTDLPLAGWTAASFLDVFGSVEDRPAAERLLTFGLMATLPTAAAGLSEWTTTRRGARRVGVAHAALNAAAALLYGSSLAARRRGRYEAATAIGVVGGLVALASSYLGGHLSLELGAGVSSAPEDAQDPL
ncbi:MAG: hypothetical protein M3N53_00195 [Actinomycetota bacterium]|nr:hypothetical protein [Actinomycetota bacterium]